MATLKEMISEIFNSEFAIGEEEAAGSTEPEQTPEPSNTQAEPETVEPEMSEEDMRKYIREELNQLYNEAKQAKARTTATMSVNNVIQPERTVDDILAERFRTVTGASKGE